MAICDDLSIRPLCAEDPTIIASAFTAQGWNKPVAQFERYLNESLSGKRDVLVAHVRDEFAGYVTIEWKPEYLPFRERSIPEIADLNVLMKFQKKGIGTRLMESAEDLISKRSDTAGIRVGLTSDYGAAQRLYFKRGYVPDGHGISQRGKFLVYGDTIVIDDDLTIGFTKALR